ncbi:kinase-like domain-containing protein [Suillus clintonianus]|uniref:kinase-like domain-containing protein n=1 Tax=Suillus clintonianus TaxID=1904413 RepID=UPI001B865106|nr:kinase-like domain-containing protein [Suillus clintonianus]KAG2121733.1 kinase-like domain-containing protein [Suillus clintonianus]
MRRFLNSVCSSRFIRRPATPPVYPYICRPVSSRLYTATPQPQEDDRPHFIFFEEPLGISAEEGCGWFQGGPGSLLGPDSCFKVEAKLGWGTTSSLWLARDFRKDRYVALKILSGFASQLNKEDKLQELKVLQHLSSDTSSPLPVDPSGTFSRLLTHFYHQGIEDDGEHLCLVMDLLGPSMHGIRDGLPNFGYLPLPIVKRMLRDVLTGIAYAHSRGVAHTDIKPDNIMIALSDKWTTEAIAEWLKANPPRTHPPEQSVTKMISAFVSQSLPPPTFSELAVGKYTLADWGSAQLVNSQTTDHITPLGLRPPEIVLGGEWDESVDIWTFGCIVFNALTRCPLFKPIDYEEKGVSEEAMLLYQMIMFCGEFFHKDLLTRCSRSHDYFNINCSLKGFDRFLRKPFQDCIRGCGYPFSDEEIEQAAAFMHRCLRLDPKNRATARDLLEDPWLLS